MLAVGSQVYPSPDLCRGRSGTPFLNTEDILKLHTLIKLQSTEGQVRVINVVKVQQFI